MALPVIETLTHTLTIPSTGEEISFRPFLVKEEKLLMQAQETSDTKTMISNIKSIVNACTFDKLNFSTLTSYDFEYVFLQLRSKSIGESVDLNIQCEECEAKNKVTVNLDSIEVKFPEEKVDNTIALNDKVFLELQPLRLKDFEQLNENNITTSIVPFIASIYDDENVWKAEDQSKKDLENFVDNLSHHNLEQIQEFIENQPKLSHEVTFKCSNCGHVNKITLEGLNNFFT